MNATGEMSTELFLKTVFDGCEHNINLRAIDSTKQLPLREAFACGTVEAVRFLERYGGSYNIYFGVATRNGSGTKEAIREIVTLHADIDFKDTPRDKALSLIASLPFWPSFLVETGGGLHVYWLLKEPEGKDAIPRVEAINRGLAKALGGDLAACDASRILRLPGSFNRKPEYGEPRPVSVIESDPTKRYNLSDFSTFEDTQPATAQHQGGKASEEIARIAECAFIAHCDRDRATLPEIQWYAMVSNLARATGGPGKIHELSKGHPKYSPKETDEKILHALNATGPHTCAFIRQHWNCGKQCPVKSPAALARKRTEPARAAEASPLAFPSDVITGAAGSFAEVYSSYLEVPPHFFFMSYLTCLGVVVADRLTLASEIAPQPRLFTLLLGESADDRKSTGLTKTVDFFRETTVGFPVCWGVGSAEGLQKRLEKSNRLLLGFDEFRQFISKCKIEASVLLPCVNTLFEANRYESRTKQSDLCLDNVYLSMLAASTISTYENTWSNQFTDIGFNNRLWLVPGGARRQFSFPAKAPESERTRLSEDLRNILRHVDAHRELDLSPEAREIYHAWYMALDRSVHTKRLDTYALRLMALLAVNELKTEVDAETVRKVITLCDHQYRVRQLHDPVDADNAVATLEEKVRRVLSARGDLKERDLKRHLHADRVGLWLYMTAIKNLQAAREIGFNRTEKTYFLRRES